jgi:hypothetical protein
MSVSALLADRRRILLVRHLDRREENVLLLATQRGVPGVRAFG